MPRSCWFTLITLALIAAPAAAQDLRAETTVGMSGRLDGVLLPGPELVAKRLDDRKDAVVLRVVQVYPHGDLGFRYDLEYSGLEPGTHDLRKYLRRANGDGYWARVGRRLRGEAEDFPTDLPPILVKVNPVLPPGLAQPHAPEIEPAPRLGGYRLLLIGLGVAWGIGFLAIVLSFFFPRRRRPHLANDNPVSLADRLRPLIEGAAAGKLSQAELAGLERGLMAYWRRRLGLESTDPSRALEVMRAHPEAGPLLARLEDWLHRPEPTGPVDVPKLLEPYRNLPPDAADLTGAEPRKGVPA